MRLFEPYSVVWRFGIEMYTKSAMHGIQWEAIRLLCFCSSPKQPDVQQKTKRQQVHAEDVNPSNDPPITSNSTHPNPL